MVEFEVARTARLSDAQVKAKQLFREIVTRDLLRPGATEKDVRRPTSAARSFSAATRTRTNCGTTSAPRLRRESDTSTITPEITSSELFAYACALAEKYGWKFGGQIAGHLIGQFLHERIAKDKISLYVHPQNDLRMRSLDVNGQPRHWILEMHFVDRTRRIGGFYEELLTI